MQVRKTMPVYLHLNVTVLTNFLLEIVDLRTTERRKPRRHRGKDKKQKNAKGKGRKGKKGKKEKRGRKKQ